MRFMEEDQHALRVYILGEDPLARAGLAASLEGLHGVLIVGQAEGSETGIESARQTSPDVILWDLGLHPSAALEHLAEHASSLPPVLALIPGEESASEAWLAGGRGILRRESEAAQIHAALVAVAHGLVVFGDVPARSIPGGSLPGTIEEPLTPREADVLRLMAEGMTNKSIAARLGITEHTAKFHVNAILRKLGAQSRTEAVVLATRRGLILL
jgi:DNA-binding NarL/FixJ family response regulator